MSAFRLRVAGLTLFLALVILFSLFRYLYTLAVLLWEAPFIDFAHYYTYASVVRLGHSPFDPQAVAQVDALLGIRRAGAGANYPPLFYVLMLPWTLMAFRTAAVAWLFLSQACVFGALALCLRRFELPSTLGVAATLFVAFNYQPLVENLALGQINPLLFLLVTLAWWGARAGWPWVAAVSVALCPFVKVQYALLLPALWWMGQRRILGRALLLIAAGLVFGLVALGPAHHAEYLRYLVASADSLRAWTANLSPGGTFHRLLSPHGDARLLADGLTVAADALLVVLFARAIPRGAPPALPAFDWAWGLAVTAIPLLSPLTEEHHLVVLLFPLTLVLMAKGETRFPSTENVLLLASILLLGSRYSVERFPFFHQGVPALFATGKLLGTICLAWLLTRLARHAALPERFRIE
jgi:hypothetical protein